MSVTYDAADELVRLLLIYVPSAPAKQLLGDFYRSKAAGSNANLKETIRRMQAVLDAQHPETNYTKQPLFFSTNVIDDTEEPR